MMKIRKLFFIAAATLGSVLLAAQSHAAGSISGLVTNIDGEPMAEVTVSADGQSMITDEGGKYLLTDVTQEDGILVTFAKEGYVTTYGVADLMGEEVMNDSDGDGVSDDMDECPGTSGNAVVTIDNRNTRVDERVRANGCSITDLMKMCADSAAERAAERPRPWWYDYDFSDYQNPFWGRWQIRARKMWDLRMARLENRYFRICAMTEVRAMQAAKEITLNEKRRLRAAIRRADMPLAENEQVVVAADVAMMEDTHALINKTLLALGGATMIDPAMGGEAGQDGFLVTFPAGSIASADTVEVRVTPIDVSTDELGGFPGTFDALDVSGGEVLLETFSLMKVDLLVDGEPVDLAEGMVASVEFLLPENTTLMVGEMVPLWYFDEAQATWVEEGSSTVGESTQIAGRLAAFGEVSHFTWWNVDKPIETQTSIGGRVVDSAGNPVSGVTVYAKGVDYNGTSYGITDANGNYCINVRVSSTVTLEGNLFADGLVQKTLPIADQATSNENQRCDDTAGAGASSAPDLMMPGLSCVSGRVTDHTGSPISGKTVYNSLGTVTVTGGDGTYCISSPNSSTITLYSVGTQSVTVNTDAGEASCSVGGCMAAPDLVGFAPGTYACLAGSVSVVTGTGAQSTTPVSMTLFSRYEEVLGEITVIGGDLYCMDSLPPSQSMFMSVNSENPNNRISCNWELLGDLNSGPATASGCGDFTACAMANVECSENIQTDLGAQ